MQNPTSCTPQTCTTIINFLEEHLFTGLIEEIGSIKSIRKKSDGLDLEISCAIVQKDSKIGDSISINGACQTVTSVDDKSFVVFVSKITSSITTLGSFIMGTPVNLERAMTPSSRFGGHIVQGHVDDTGEITKVEDDQNGREVHISASKEIMRYIVEKGSITVDGTSLTVVKVSENGFLIYLIPETLKKTIIRDYKVGAQVNLEVDILAKYVEKMLHRRDEPGENGFSKRDENMKKKLFEEGFM